MQTGLEWNPCSLAAQIALVQNSNIFPAFSDLERLDFVGMESVRRGWDRTHGVPRLGYWSIRGDPSAIVHGIRFMNPKFRTLC